MPTQRNALGGAVVNGKAYAIGGLSFPDVPAGLVNANEEFSPEDRVLYVHEKN
jgi:hypothetical protein